MVEDRCPAMIDANIEKPDSIEGKDFCIAHCPYPRCYYDVIEKDRRRSHPKMKIENQSVISKDNLFTTRELDVIKAVSLGMTNQGIASFLKIDVKTIEHHLNTIYSKLKCHLGLIEKNQHLRVSLVLYYLSCYKNEPDLSLIRNMLNYHTNSADVLRKILKGYHEKVA